MNPLEEKTAELRSRTIDDIREAAERLRARKATARGIQYWVRELTKGERLGGVLGEHAAFEDALEQSRELPCAIMVIRVVDGAAMTFPRSAPLSPKDVERLLKRIERARPAETPDPNDLAAVDENAPIEMEES